MQSIDCKQNFHNLFILLTYHTPNSNTNSLLIGLNLDLIHKTIDGNNILASVHTKQVINIEHPNFPYKTVPNKPQQKG